jgi:hypothetical protein
MNDHLPTDQRELEKATLRQLPLNGSGLHEVNAVAARKAWLAMGAAVEANGREGLNQQALLASLQAELVKKQPEDNGDHARQVDWSWAAVAIAASILLAATMIGVISQRTEKVPSIAPGPQLVQPSPPKAPSRPNVVPPDSLDPATNQSLVAATAATDSWNDLDEAINTTYTALQQMSRQQSDVDQSLTDFDTQLKQLSADIAGESL